MRSPQGHIADKRERVRKEYLSRRIREAEENIRRLEDKYGMSFEEFEKKLSEMEDVPPEMSKDYILWETSIRFLRKKGSKS